MAPRLVFSSLDPDVQWNLIDVGVSKAWNFTQGRSDIVVAVIDSGIDFSHPDLVNQSWKNPDEIPDNGLDDDENGYVDDVTGWDFRDNDNDPSPGHRHGTFVAGLIAADDDNHITVGIAPNIRLMALRFLNDQNRFEGGDWDMFIEALDYAVDNGADILQLSIQADGVPPESFHTAITRVYNRGVVIVSVTGNNQDEVTYPGKYSEVIAVSATTKERKIAYFSSPGDQNEICAPGYNVTSIYPGLWTPQTGSGTSFAAPLVSGAIALILSLNNTLTIETIRSILHETSTDLGTSGKDPIFGYGLLNVSAALEKVVIEHNNGTTVIPIETSSNMTTLSTNGTTISWYSGILALVLLFLKKRLIKTSKK
ncbi:MAG: S8 family serine peptidase [Candidatus Hodarchaeota archaeon]